MALLLMLLCSLFVQNLRSSDLYWVSTSYNICGSLDIAYGFNCSAFVHSPQMPKELAEDLNLAWSLPRDILQLQNLVILNDYFAFDDKHYWDSHFKSSTDFSYTDGKQRWLIFLLFIIYYYVKLVHSESIGKQLEVLAVKVELAKGLYVTVVGCYTG